MRYIHIAVALATLSLGIVAAQSKKAPETVVFKAKTGNVTYNHAAHAKREKGDCKVCHDAVFPQSRAPINFKSAMHKTAEADHKSCGFCHYKGGKAFGAVGNCTKCHVKGAAKG